MGLWPLPQTGQPLHPQQHQHRRAARYGYKQDATALLIEWVQTVGAEAGIKPDTARISTGALGAPESRLEVRGVGG